MTRILGKLPCAIAIVAIASCTTNGPGVTDDGPPGPIKVGEEVDRSYQSPAFEPIDDGRQLVWQETIEYANATYIAIHFDGFALPDGAELIVRTPDGSRRTAYTSRGKDIPGEAGFWAMHMPGDAAVLELYSRAAVPAGAVSIDRFARGLPVWDELAPKALPDPDDGEGDIETEAICGADDSEWAKCYQTSEAAAYDESRAVARLMINGSSACTGWLVGSAGHLMTNEHCIGSSSTAANTDYEFMAEGGSCGTSCSSWGACPGTVVASSATAVRINASLDYTLVQLPTNPTGTYGYMQLRESGATVGERIYIPQHPAAWGKKIAMKDGANDAVVTGMVSACTFGAPVPDVGYMADTQGGSSGSPVLGYDDNLVIAIHHCANCPNRGVPIDAIVSDMQGAGVLPPDALGSACSPSPVADAGADQTICAGSSTTIGAPAQAGHSYSWSPGGATTAEVTVSPSSTTTYTVTATTSCGSASDSVTVTVDSGGGGGFTDDMEGGASSWTMTGLWHHVSGSSCASPGSSSGTDALYYGQDSSCNYSTGSTTSGSATSPTISGITASSELHFQYFRQVESYSGDYDQTIVEVSDDGGASWTEVWKKNSRDASENAWTASGAIGLSAFAGSDIQVRFRFNSRDGLYNNFTGWLIDDVEVTGSSACP